ncbi:MarR family winged helix-turn-helix transcriptional regulator [Jiulongibacter sediminis]|jgi:DNA-binding MarR family transcriptional regulator|uniref:MarR family winged helix-turn-helix transcriptional regulator n=1 Tax=Jiulongibacter sediminis TaxID=1605367 RepID=UPI0026F07DFD|nr:MarR family transcriptional regulator [Jiulongibacter sediminis]
MSSKSENLLLENQICFHFYAISRLTNQLYTSILKKLNITYPQYLVLLVLWERDGQMIKDLGERLLLDTNTLTPLLKRMQQKGLLSRERSGEDERKVIVSLTPKGQQLKEEAVCIPQEIMSKFSSEGQSAEQAAGLRKTLQQILETLKEKA